MELSELSRKGRIFAAHETLVDSPCSHLACVPVSDHQTPGWDERDAGEAFGASSTNPIDLDGFEEKHTEAVPNGDKEPPQYGLGLIEKMLFGAPEGSQEDEEERREGSIWGSRRSLNRQNRYKVRIVTHL